MVAFSGDRTIKLVVKGPKSIVEKQRKGKVFLNQTWKQFLKGKRGLKLSSDNGKKVIIRTVYPPDGRGWIAELNEKIEKFVGRFIQKRKKITVQLEHMQEDKVQRLISKMTNPQDTVAVNEPPTTGGARGLSEETKSRQTSYNLRKRAEVVMEDYFEEEEQAASEVSEEEDNYGGESEDGIQAGGPCVIAKIELVDDPGEMVQKQVAVGSASVNRKMAVKTERINENVASVDACMEENLDVPNAAGQNLVGDNAGRNQRNGMLEVQVKVET